MKPGHYVVRLPSRSIRDRLAIETRPFRIDPADLADIVPGIAPDDLSTMARTRGRREAETWAQGLRSTNRRDDIFVIEVGADPEAPALSPTGTLRGDGRYALPAGFYVVRIPARGSGTRLSVQSVCFAIRPDVYGAGARERALESADGWCGFIAGQHPRDTVFVIEREAEEPLAA